MSEQLDRRPVALFYSYAQEDEPFREQLEKHLSLLQRQGLISPWHHRQILPGQPWAQEIDEHLQMAAIILLLISPDFLASDYCYEIEMRRAIERHQRGEARVIPLILRPCDWHDAPFGSLEALPRNRKPISTWKHPDEAFAEVAHYLRQIIEHPEDTSLTLIRSSNPPTQQKHIPRRSILTLVLSTIGTAGAAGMLWKFWPDVGTIFAPSKHLLAKVPTHAPEPPITPSTSASYSLFFGSNDNNVYGVDDSGHPLWPPFTTGSYVDSSPIIVGDTIYVGSQDAHVYGIDARTGLPVCNFAMGARTVSSPVYSNGLIYIGSQDHYVYAFTPNCQVKWKTLVSEAIDASAAVSDGVVYICSRDNHIYALRADKGSLLWMHPAGSSTPFVENSTVYVGSGNGLYALDARTGAEKWVFSRGSSFNSPFVMSNVVYAATGDDKARLYAVHTNDGSVVWSFQAEGAVDSLPRVVNGIIYIGSEDKPGHVYAIRSEDGSLLWKRQVPGEVYTSVIYANGVLYFGCQDSSLYALNAIDGSFRQSFGTNGSVKTNDEVNSTPLVIPSL